MTAGLSFASIRERAEARKGGSDALDALLPILATPADLASVPDDRWLSDMTKRVFQAGFNWDLIERKWPAFEDAFEGFGPARWAMMSPDDEERLLSDSRIVRNGAKIRSVQANAAFLTDLAAEHGSAARAIAAWPATDFVGLLALLKSRGSRLGGATGQWLLRGMGVDGFVLTRDVTAALIREGIVDRPPTSKRDLAAVQAAMNDWRAETGLPLTHLSKILAFSVESEPNPNHSPL